MHGPRITAIAAALFLAGCSVGARETSGTVIGGFAGDRQDSASEKIAATITGSMASGLVDGEIGTDLNSRDRRQALNAEYNALEFGQPGQPVTWDGGGASGVVVAAQPYRVGSQDCRQYEHTVVHDGSEQSVQGTACRNPDGSWTPLI